MTGFLFARFVKSLAICKGDPVGASAFAAAQRWIDSDRIASIHKAAAGALSTADMTAAMAPVSADLSEFLRARTIVGRLPGLVRVPFRTRLLATTVGAAAGWVGEGKPIPVSSAELTGTELQALKIATIAILTRELIQMSSPVADMLIAREIGNAIATALDRQFVDPSYTGIADTSPPSITSSSTQLSSSGSTIAAIDADIKAMIQVLVDANMSLDTAVFLMHPTTATGLALKRNGDGGPAYPGMTSKGGVLAGLPVITSTALSSAGSPGEFNVVLLETSEIAVADDGASEISYSSQASLQLDNAPASGAQQLISLYSNNLVAIRAVRMANWQARRTGAAVVLRDVQF